MEVVEGEERIYGADEKSRLEQLAEPKSNFDTTKYNFPINEDAQATVRPILTKTLTYVPSERLQELACPKWPFFIYNGAEPFQFIRRENLELPEDYPFGPEDVLGFMSRHKQIQSYWPSTIANFLPVLHPMKQKEPRLVTFPKPIATGSKKPCSQRISVLAKPRQNSLEILKKESDRAKKIYTVSKSALKAVPSPRIVALATPKPDRYLEALKQEAIEVMKSKGLRQKKERSGRDERRKKSKGSKQIQDSALLPAKMVKPDKKIRKSIEENITEKHEMPIVEQKKEIAGKRMDRRKSKVRATSRKLSLRKYTDASKQREKTEISLRKKNITEDKIVIAFKLDEKEKKRKESMKKDRKETKEDIKDKFSEEYLRQLPKAVSKKQLTSLAEAEKTVTDVVKSDRVKKQEAEKIDAVKPSTTKKKKSPKSLIAVVKPDTMKVQEKFVPGKKEKKERKQSVKKIPRELPQTKLSISKFTVSSTISDLNPLEIDSQEPIPVGESIVADRQGVTKKDHDEKDEAEKEIVLKTKPKPPKHLISKPIKVKLSKKESKEKNLSKSVQELATIRKESAPILTDERKEKATLEDTTQHEIQTDVISSVTQPKLKYPSKESETKDVKKAKHKTKLLSKENGSILTKQDKPAKKTKIFTTFDKDKNALDTKTLEVIKIDETGLVDKGIKEEIELSEISLEKKSKGTDQKTIENHLQDKDRTKVVDEKSMKIGEKVKEHAEVTDKSKEHDIALDTKIGGTDDISKSEKKKLQEQLTSKVEVTKNIEDKRQEKLLDRESAQHDTFGVAIKNGIVEKEKKDTLKDVNLEFTKVNEANIVMPTEVSNLEKQQDQTQYNLETSLDLPEEKNIPEPQTDEMSVSPVGETGEIFGDTGLESKTAEQTIRKMSLEDQQLPTELHPSAFSAIESLTASTEKIVEDEKEETKVEDKHAYLIEKETKLSAAFNEAIATKTKDKKYGKELPSKYSKSLSTQDKNILDEKGIIDVEHESMACRKEEIEDSISDETYIVTTSKAIEEPVESPAIESLDSAEEKDILEEKKVAETENACIKEQEIKRSETLDDLITETAKYTKEVTLPSPMKSLSTVEETSSLSTFEEEKGAELSIEPEKGKTTDTEEDRIKEKLEIEGAVERASETERATVTQSPSEKRLIAVVETSILPTIEEKEGVELSHEAKKGKKADVIIDRIKEKQEIETTVETERETQKATIVESQSPTKKYSDDSKNVDALTTLKLEKISEQAIRDKDKVKSDTSDDKGMKKEKILYPERIAKDNEKRQPIIQKVKPIACPAERALLLKKSMSLQKARAPKSRSQINVKRHRHLEHKPKSPQKEDSKIIQRRKKMDLNETISIQTITVPSLQATHRECIVINLGTEEKVAEGIFIEGVEFDEMNKGKQEDSNAELMSESDKEGRKLDKTLLERDVEKEVVCREISYPSNATVIALSANPINTQLAVNMNVERKIEVIEKKQSAAVILLPGSKTLIEKSIEEKQTPVAKVIGYSFKKKDESIIVIGDIKDSEPQDKIEEPTLQLIQMETLSVTEPKESTGESNVVTVSIRKAIPGRKLSYLTPPPLKIPAKLKYSKFLLATVEDIKHLF